MQQKDPDIILRAAHALPDQVKQMFADEFNTNDIWKHFRAVQNGRVYDLDPALFNMSANFSYGDALQALQPCFTANKAEAAKFGQNTGVGLLRRS